MLVKMKVFWNVTPRLTGGRSYCHSAGEHRIQNVINLLPVDTI